MQIIRNLIIYKMYADDNIDFKNLQKSLNNTKTIFVTQSLNYSSDPKCVNSPYSRKPLIQMMKSRKYTNVHMNIVINNIAPSLA
jgi:hypothetical protein